MKKTLLSLALALLSSLSMSAKDYTDKLVVTVNGLSTQQNATISVDKNDDGTYNFNLKNFMLKMGKESMDIGNITLNNLKAAKSNKGDVVTFNDSIKIEKGDDPNRIWAGPSLPKIPLNLKLLVNDKKLYTLIDIDMQQTIKQTIHVTFGDNYQLPNSGFASLPLRVILFRPPMLSLIHTPIPPTSYAVALRAKRVCCSPRPLSLALSQTALSPQDACRQEP